jgi:hypothetical protein
MSSGAVRRHWKIAGRVGFYSAFSVSQSPVAKLAALPTNPPPARTSHPPPQAEVDTVPVGISQTPQGRLYRIDIILDLLRPLGAERVAEDMLLEQASSSPSTICPKH